MTFTKLQEALAVKEFESLRNKMDQCIAEYRALERYAVIGTAAVYSFGFTASAMQYRYLIFFVPLLIVLAGAVRALALRKYVHFIGSYILEIEKAVYGSEGKLGYEKYFTNFRKSSMEDFAANSVWILLIVFNALVWLVITGSISVKLFQ
jgi:hypothetical protein